MWVRNSKCWEVKMLESEHSKDIPRQGSGTDQEGRRIHEQKYPSSRLGMKGLSSQPKLVTYLVLLLLLSTQSTARVMGLGGQNIIDHNDQITNHRPGHWLVQLVSEEDWGVGGGGGGGSSWTHQECRNWHHRIPATGARFWPSPALRRESLMVLSRGEGPNYRVADRGPKENMTGETVHFFSVHAQPRSL